MKTIGIVTSARSDFGFYLPLMNTVSVHPDLKLEIVATGMHLAPEFGMTVRYIEDAGFSVRYRIENLVASDTSEGVGKSMGLGIIGFSQLFAEWRPDILVVFGDRFDMFPAALAALPFRIPVAHIAGGEITEGAIDDALRHGMTKLSHLHFVATKESAKRILQMGEEPWRVMVCGSLAVDNIRQATLWTREETARHFGFDLTRPIALITYHSVTLEHDRSGEQIHNLLQALEESRVQCIFTHPNADTGGREVAAAIKRFCDGQADRFLVLNAEQPGYFSLLNTASVMVGNSSSGLVEAPSFELPVVDIGSRQAGRLHPGNVITCGYQTKEILQALQLALSPQFRASLSGLENPYGDGHTAERIVNRLATLEDLPHLLRKKFCWNTTHSVSVGGVI